MILRAGNPLDSVRSVIEGTVGRAGCPALGGRNRLQQGRSGSLRVAYLGGARKPDSGCYFLFDSSFRFRCPPFRESPRFARIALAIRLNISYRLNTCWASGSERKRFEAL